MQRDDLQLLWAPCPSAASLRDDEVHVWSASLCLTSEQLAQMRAVLSRDEQLRGEKSPLIEQRNRFIAGRGLLRHILAPYAGVEPQDLQFAYGHAGKPYLPENAEGLRFNMSHSGNLALVAVTRSCEVGVDVEHVCEMPEMDYIVLRFFSDGARAQFQSANAADRLQVFFKCWTEQEAISKCTGEGIAEERPACPSGIHVTPLAPAIGYAASLAVNGAALKLRTQHFLLPSSTTAQAARYSLTAHAEARP